MTAGESKLLEFIYTKLKPCKWKTDNLYSGVYTQNGCRLHFLFGDDENYANSPNNISIGKAGYNWYIEKFRKVLFGGKIPISCSKIATGDASEKNTQIFSEFLNKVNGIANADDFVLLSLVTKPAVISNPVNKLRVVPDLESKLEIGCDCTFSDSILKEMKIGYKLFNATGIEDGKLKISAYDESLNSLQNFSLSLEPSVLKAMIDSGEFFVAHKEYYTDNEETYIWKFNDSDLKVNPILDRIKFELTESKKAFINQAMNECLNFSDLLAIPDSELESAYEFLKIGASLNGVKLHDAKISSHILDALEYGVDYKALSQLRGNFESYISSFNARIQKVIDKNNLDQFSELSLPYKYAVANSALHSTEFQDPEQYNFMELIMNDLVGEKDQALVEFVSKNGLYSYHDVIVPVNVLSDGIKEMVVRKLSLDGIVFGKESWNDFIKKYLDSAISIGYNYLKSFYIERNNSSITINDNYIALRYYDTNIWSVVKLNGELYVCKNEEKLTEFHNCNSN